MKKCPFCAEEIQDEAIKCRFCGEMLHAAAPKEIRKSAAPSTQNKRPSAWQEAWQAGCAMVIILAIGCVVYALHRSLSNAAPTSTSNTVSLDASAPPPKAAYSADSSSNASKAVAPSRDALSDMAAVFVGGHSKAEIKSQLDRAMELYGLPKTEENYGRCGSCLVVLRQDLGVEEMEVLRYMIKFHVPGVALKFPEAAALQATALRLDMDARGEGKKKGKYQE